MSLFQPWQLLITILAGSMPALMTVALFVQTAAGATYAVVSFINPKSLGWVAGIVGAGGNLVQSAPDCCSRTSCPGHRRC